MQQKDNTFWECAILKLQTPFCKSNSSYLTKKKNLLIIYLQTHILNPKYCFVEVSPNSPLINQ